VKQPDYNIEFAHIYADEHFGPEQQESMQILKKVISRLEKEGKSYVTTVLIDDFNPVNFRFDEKKLLATIAKAGVAVDFIGYESRLGSVSDKLIREIPKAKLKLELFHKPQKEVLLFDGKKKIGLREHFPFMYRHTCSLLSASWTLCRLGAYPLPRNAVKNLTNKRFTAERTITILQRKYQDGEHRVLEIIESTKFKPLLKSMEYEFFGDAQ
jgi:hypothetical protein